MVLHEIDVPIRRDADGSGDVEPEWEALRKRLRGRTIWHVNSTRAGGGVAEMLPSLVGSARGHGIDMRWLALDGTPEFFAVTKRIHHALHGSAGDGHALDARARATYEATLAPVAKALLRHVGAGDVILLHDPQTAGLAPAAVAAGHPVIWRCHVGDDTPSDEVARGWAFLRGYLADVDAYVFSRPTYVPAALDPGRAVIIPPAIDPASAKNELLSSGDVRRILVRAGLVAGRVDGLALHVSSPSGETRIVRRRARVLGDDAPPTWDAPLVVQVSRWDPLKDFGGVMLGYAALAVGGRLPTDARLVLAGPRVDGVADDPEARAAFTAVAHEWRVLPPSVRARVSLVELPTDDVAENATIVNALQRHASVVVQKSLREGFGLTVAEAMWKSRPVLASAVGGIQDQLTDGVTGVLLSHPRDLGAYADALGALLADPARATRLGRAAHDAVADRFLTPRHLRQEVELCAEVAKRHAAPRTAARRQRGKESQPRRRALVRAAAHAT